MPKYLTSILKFVVSFAILYYLAQQAIADEQFSKLSETRKDWRLLSLGFLCTFLAIVIGIFRWKCLVNALGIPFSSRDALRIGLMGQFFNVIAFGTLGADAMRAFYLSQKFRERKSEAIVTVFADRFTGLLTMLFMGAVAFFVLDRFDLVQVDSKYQATLRRTGQLVSMIAVAFTLSLAILVLIPRVEKFSWFQNVKEIPTLGPLFTRILNILDVYRNRPSVWLVSCLMSVATNIFFMLAIFLIARGISHNSPDFFSHTFIEPIAMVCNAIPLPGGLGGMEFALSILYRALGSQQGIVVAFTFRLSLLLIACLGGTLWFLNRKQMK